MSQKTWIFWISLVLVGVMSSFLAQTAAADTPPAVQQPQVQYQTPTARPDGRVIYVVQEGDSCLRIQLLTGTTIDQLRTFNKLDQNCTIAPGKELLLAVITPAASPTPNPLITATPLLPSPTPMKGNGQICVLLFNDVNGDAVHQETETSIGGGAVSITNRLGSVSKTANTTDTDTSICQEVPEGEYNISMAIPPGYNPTKAVNATVQVKAGDQQILEFGAQISSSAVETPTTGQPKGETNTVVAVLGGVFILFGIGLGAYILFKRK